MSLNLHAYVAAGALCVSTLIAPSISYAQGNYFYAEGSVSRVQAQDADATTSASAGGFSASLDATLEFEDSIGFGAELGLGAIADTGLRLGVSITRFKAEFEGADVSGAIAFNGTNLLAGAGRVTPDDLNNAGFTFDNTVKIYSVNSYYDFDFGSSFVPYLGVGVGLTDIENAEDKEFTLSGYAGVNYAINENLYTGLRGSYHRINGPTDKIGLNYDDLGAWSTGIVFGVKFN